MDNERGSGIAGLLYVLLAFILFFTGYELWLRQQRSDAPPLAVSSSTSAAPISPPKSSSATPEIIPLVAGVGPQPGVFQPNKPEAISHPTAPEQGSDESIVRLAEPGELPASIYAGNFQSILLLAQQGNLSEAQTKLAALPKEAFADPQSRKTAARLWIYIGAKLWDAQGPATALPLMKKAIAVDPDNPPAYQLLIRGYAKLNSPELTRDLLEKGIAMSPNDPWLHLYLADLLFDKDDLSGAALHLDHATNRAAQTPAFQSSLKIMTDKVKRAEKAEQKFVSRDSSHFKVKFDGNDDYEVWNRVLEILEDAYREIGQKFSYFPSKPIMVVLHSRQAFRSATGSPAWADGLFDGVLGRIQIPTQGALTDQQWLTRVLRHEYVHALLHDRMGGRLGAVPTWLNEGLAMQLAGDPWPDLDEIVRGRGRTVTLIPLSNLEGGWGNLPTTLAQLAYLEGNSATLYLIDRFGMEKMRELVGQLSKGQSMDTAVADRLFIPYAEFERRWIDHLNEKLKAGRT